ncbi:hypothetical protein AN217_16755 [Streptomyces qinglanensis]|uniref:Uncharacterized protein n=1 Tax=Streptomyces qinglanensis TaxID=943816 RepID=A0A1E7K5S3_9ACTN|nr:hypothetical protein AN217_16755 [Streptomyces qinglanensis]
MHQPDGAGSGVGPARYGSEGSAVVLGPAARAAEADGPDRAGARRWAVRTGSGCRRAERHGAGPGGPADRQVPVAGRPSAVGG